MENDGNIHTQTGKSGTNRDQSDIEFRGENPDVTGPLRSLIPELDGSIDIATTVRELAYARDRQNALGFAVSELKSAIRKHRDSHALQLHRTYDIELYGMLD